MTTSFDVTAFIAEFAADTGVTSVELPHMTTGQRKAAKKLLEQYPDIRCESFGFGQERQLHLFKKSAAEVCPAVPETSQTSDVTLPAVSVKNTFIDDWLDCTPSDRRVVQSMPHGMFSQCMLSEANAASDTATTAGDDTPPEGSESEPPARWSDAPAADDLESMPCPLVEAQAKPKLSLMIGALVVVEGLVKVPAFNGCSAVVQSWDEATGRYNILLTCPEGLQQAKIKQDNLRVVLPPLENSTSYHLPPMFEL
jgi:hypothetical protein